MAKPHCAAFEWWGDFVAIDHRLTDILIKIRDSLNELIAVIDDAPSVGPAKPKVPKNKEFIAAYCERFKSRWGHNPEIFPKHAGIVKSLAKTLTLEKFEFYMDAYFLMPDSWIVKAKHPLEFFQLKFNEIQVFAQSGKFTTLRQSQQNDDAVAVSDQLQRIKEGKL